jgi:SAM-dependent methyltransferase
MENNFVKRWDSLHQSFIEDGIAKNDDWLDEFQDIISNVSDNIIDLGCGVTGNNTIYLLDNNKRVISCDFSEVALNEVQKIEGAKTCLFDMTHDFPFEDNFTDLIIADLSLHYFRDDVTKRILHEIKRVLKANGYLFFRVNSTNSSEYKSLVSKKVKQIEKNLFYNNDMEKRFFSSEDLDEYFSDWKWLCKREENMTRWSSDKIIWKCAVCNIQKRREG